MLDLDFSRPAAVPGNGSLPGPVAGRGDPWDSALPDEAARLYDPAAVSPPMDRTVRIVATLLTAASLLLGLWVGVRTAGRIGEPWAGFAILPEGRVAPPVLLPLRLVSDTPVRLLDRIVAVDGERVTAPADVAAVVARVPEGTPLVYRLERGGRMLDVTVPTTVFTRSDFVEACLPFLFGGVLGLVLGVVPVLARPDATLPRIFCAINVGLAVDLAFRFVDAYVVHGYPRLGPVPTAAWVGSFFHLGFVHPTRREPLVSHPTATLAAVYGVALAASVLNVASGQPMLMIATVVVANLLWLGNVVDTAARTADRRLRQQAIVVIAGAAPQVVSAAVHAGSALGWYPPLPLIVHFLALWLFGGTLAYAVVQHNLFEVDAVVRRALALGLLAVGAVGVYVGLALLASVWLEPAMAWAAAGVVVVLLLTLAPVVGPLRRRLEERIEQLLFPRQRDARATIHRASRELRRLRDETELPRFLRETIAGTMAASSVRLLAGRPDEPLVVIGAADAAAALRLAPDDPLHAVARGREAVNAEALAARPQRGRLRAAIARAGEIGAGLVVPLPASGAVAGALVLGPREDGRLYTRDDEMLLETLAGQVASALENARAWEAVRELERRLKAENLYLRQEVQLAHDPGGIVGASAALRAVLAQVEQVAPTDATVLVVGETGTGKELVVCALHAQSRRRERTLVKVACAALPEALLESELFGHERGAFTGATARKPGRFEVADGGTLFLDDVDTLPLGVQAKLLRALQEGEVQRLGSNEVRRVDVRVVAATNRDLLGEVRAGRFREDLYYRLNVIPIRLPPLRERREDVPLLVEHFVRQDGAKLGRHIGAVAAEAMAMLQAYPWPGNVRELRNVIQRALVLCTDDVLRLPGPLEAPSPNGGPDGDDGSGAPLADQVRDLKVRLIRAALAASNGNQRIAAERLGLHRQSLTRMIKDLGL